MYISSDIIKNSKVINKIGKGTFGSIYLYELPNGERVAVKESITNNTNNYNNVGYTKDFIRELDSLIKFRPMINVITLKGACFDLNSDKGYILMEKMDTDLRKWIKASSFDERIIYIEQFIKQIIGTLGIMHKIGFVHNDIKSNNILLNKSGEKIIFKLADFGKCSYVTDDKLPYEGIKIYTSPYRFSIYADEYWAISVVLTEIITRERVFRNSSELDINKNTYLNKNKFMIKEFIRSILKSSQYNKIPKIYWDFVEPIFNREDLRIDQGLSRIGYDVNLEKLQQIKSGFIERINFSTSDTDKVTSYFCNLIANKYNKYPIKINDKKIKYLNLINTFYSKYINQLDPIHIKIFAEVAYVCVVGRNVQRLDYCKNYKKFMDFQRAFLDSLDLQSVIV